MHKSFIFREYDIRGVYEKDFDLLFAKELAQALISFIVKRGPSSPVVTVGYDARLSSPAIMKAVVDGFVSSRSEERRVGKECA